MSIVLTLPPCEKCKEPMRLVPNYTYSITNLGTFNKFTCKCKSENYDSHTNVMLEEEWYKYYPRSK
jgi:hypothetical protein